MNKSLKSQAPGRKRWRAARSLVGLVAAALMLQSIASPAHAVDEDPQQWTPVDINGQTINEPAAVAVTTPGGSDHLIVAVEGAYNDRIWWNVDHGPFHQIDLGSTQAAVSVTQFGNNVIMVHSGQNGQIYYSRLVGFDTGAAPSSWWWANWVAVPGSHSTNINLRPTLAATANGLVIGWVSAIGEMWIQRMATNLTFPNANAVQLPGGGVTRTAMSATSLTNGDVYFFHHGTNNLIFWARLSQNGNYDGWHQYGTGVTYGSASATTYWSDSGEQRVMLAVTGTDHLPWTSSFPAGNPYAGTGFVRIPNDGTEASHGGSATTAYAPNIAHTVHGVAIFITWAYGTWARRIITKHVPGT
jgi:hypothetical protein